MWSWLKSMARAPAGRAPVALPDALWQATVQALPFLAALDAARQQRLRVLVGGFLATKEFHGTHGLEITDAMATSIAAQACLPLVDLRAPPAGPRGDPLGWYADFVGIVVHRGEVVA
ncbi:MAG: hypothetical protein JWQ88_2356, partial [Rhodoferax sp.]|nr:hypothetical protein [Rhodoferax sp.]